MAAEDKFRPGTPEWKELQKELSRDSTTGQLYQENVAPTKKVTDWLGMNALVPFGMAATAFSLAMGIKKKGNTNNTFWLGCRVGFQGLTVGCLMVGAVMADRQRAMQAAERHSRK